MKNIMNNKNRNEFRFNGAIGTIEIVTGINECNWDTFTKKGFDRDAVFAKNKINKLN